MEAINVADKQKKYAFTGPFADINFGDYAMLIINIYDLNIKECTIFSYDTHFSESIKKDYLDSVEIKIFEVDLFDKSIDKNNITPFEVLNLVKNKKNIYEEIDKIDTLIVNGGGYFNGLWSMPHRIEKLTKIIVPILMANQLNKEIIFTGNGYGPFGEDEEFFSSIFNVLKNVSYGSRDNLYSPIWLNKLGVRSESIELIPDDLLIVNSKLKNLPLNFYLQSNNYIVMETYLSLDYLKENIHLIKSFSEYLKEKHNLDIVFLPLNLEHGGMDQALYLKGELNNFEFVDIRETGYLPIQDAENIIHNAELVICSRYHALVFALSNKTPVISVLKEVMENKKYYYNKNFGVMRQVFENMPIHEHLYLADDYIKSLEYIQNHFEEIIQYQKNNYLDEKFDFNIITLDKIRKAYLSRK